MSYINVKSTENLFTMTLDMMELAEKQLKKTGKDKKNIVLDMLEDLLGDDFPTYKRILEEIIDGICLLAKNKKILDKINKIKYCCI